jgi:N-acetylmuramic acid 6-phosphate (MurNAc-6-P) etherase
MVDLRATNIKLKARSVRIVAAITGLSEEGASEQLARCNGEVKTAVVAIKQAIDASEARMFLERSNGRLRAALELAELESAKPAASRA